MLKVAAQAIDRLTWAMQLVAGVLLLGVVLVTTADVTARKLFSWTGGAINFTFSGGIEMVSLGTMYAMLLCMPYVVDRGQIIMDLLIGPKTPLLSRVLDTGYMAVFAVGAAMLAWASYVSGIDSLRTHERTSDLHLPASWLGFSAAFLFLVLAVRTAFVTIDVAAGRRQLGPGDDVARVD